MTDLKESNDKKFVKIRINVGSNVFHYSGTLLEETDEFVKLIDIKDGELKLSKDKIISIQYLKEGETNDRF